MKETHSWRKLSQFFQIICTVGAICLLSWCFYEFSKNEDVVEVSFKKYGNDEDSIYPDVSLCFDHPFNEDKLKEFDNALTKSIYTIFLTGQDFFGHWEEKALSVDYENVSLQLNEYLVGKAIVFPSGTATAPHKNISINNFTIVAYPICKCFTFHLPIGIKLMSVSIALRNTIFPSGLRPKSGFDIVLHYPQQIVRSWQFFVRNWPMRTNFSSRSYQMDINVKDVEVLKHRNKPKTPCSQSISYDNDTIKDILQSVGCVPPYLKNNIETPFDSCRTKEELQLIANSIFEAFGGAGNYEHVIPPCKEVQRLGVDVADTDFNISKILSGEDVDINLQMPFILESWLRNGR